MLIHVDRDLVAAADDTESHGRTLRAHPSETLGAPLGRLTPDVSVRGPAAWAVRLSSGEPPGEYLAVYSAELGGMRVARDGERTLGSFSQPSVRFCYFGIAPAELLLARSNAVRGRTGSR